MEQWVPSLYKRNVVSTDTAHGRSVTFTTSVEVTGDASSPLPESAYRRLLCHFVVSKLQDSDLADAQDKLIDLYLWHLTKPLTSLTHTNKHRVITRKVGQSRRILVEED